MRGAKGNNKKTQTQGGRLGIMVTRGRGNAEISQETPGGVTNAICVRIAWVMRGVQVYWNYVDGRGVGTGMYINCCVQDKTGQSRRDMVQDDNGNVGHMASRSYP